VKRKFACANPGTVISAEDTYYILRQPHQIELRSSLISILQPNNPWRDYYCTVPKAYPFGISSLLLLQLSPGQTAPASVLVEHPWARLLYNAWRSVTIHSNNFSRSLAIHPAKSWSNVRFYVCIFLPIYISASASCIAVQDFRIPFQSLRSIWHFSSCPKCTSLWLKVLPLDLPWLLGAEYQTLSGRYTLVFFIKVSSYG
jgi:hypothetical protein